MTPMVNQDGAERPNHFLVLIEGDGAESAEDGIDVEDAWLEGSPKGQAIVRAIGAYQSRHPWCPSYREVMDAAGVRSTSHLRFWLGQLSSWGFIAWGDCAASRQIALTERGWWAFDELDEAA